jgi:hypothetical protein
MGGLRRELDALVRSSPSRGTHRCFIFVPPQSCAWLTLKYMFAAGFVPKFTSQQLQRVCLSRHGFRLDRHDDLRIIILGRVHPRAYRVTLSFGPPGKGPKPLFRLHQITKRRGALPGSRPRILNITSNSDTLAVDKKILSDHLEHLLFSAFS